MPLNRIKPFQKELLLIVILPKIIPETTQKNCTTIPDVKMCHQVIEKESNGRSRCPYKHQSI